MSADRAARCASGGAPRQQDYAPDPVHPQDTFVEGDILAAPAGADHFRIAVPSRTSKVSFACASRRAGSGLRGFTGALFDPSTALTIGWAVTEHFQ